MLQLALRGSTPGTTIPPATWDITWAETKMYDFPYYMLFRAELHQKIQSKSVTIFHPLAIHTHTHTNKGHYVQILFFIGKSY